MINICSKPIPGFIGLYAVYANGEVYSLPRFIVLNNGSKRKVGGRWLKQKNVNGYKVVTLCRKGIEQRAYVHRLVAQAFIDNPDNLPYVNHLDGCPANNHVDNLEWVTHSQNVKHGYDMGLNNNKGGGNGFAVGVIDNEMGQRFSTIKDWAEARGLNYNTARNILNGYNSAGGLQLGTIIKLKAVGYGKDNGSC